MVVGRTLSGLLVQSRIRLDPSGDHATVQNGAPMNIVEAGQAVILGIVEGLTEFLPISSTGHLVVAEQLLDFKDPGEVFTVVIQLGAILAVCWYYRERLWTALRGFPADPLSRRFAVSVILACLPAAVIGLLCHDWIEDNFFIPAVVALTSSIGGLVILLIEGRRRHEFFALPTALPWRTSLGIGLCQLLALVPGVSRSGSTIMGAICLGVERRAATEFSFFLAIPIMVGASGLKIYKHHNLLTPDRIGVIAIGFVVSFFVALLVVHWLLKFVAGHDFKAFAWYRLVTGLLLAAALAAGWITTFEIPLVPRQP
jgi:undecaprenyl-diphosphatase